MKYFRNRRAANNNGFKQGMLRSILAIALMVGVMPQARAVCDWPVISDPDLVNIAYPDTNAIYWLTVIPAIPGTRLRIEGQFPDARYFSFNVYDPLIRPTDALADLELTPDVGDINPFRSDRGDWGGRYTAFLEIGPAPAERTANTLYTGEFVLPGGLPAIPNQVFTVIYRVYIPADVNHPEGGVPLPKLYLELPGVELPLERCGPFTDSPLALNPLTQVTGSTDWPEVARVNTPLIKDEPEFIKFYGLPNAASYFIDNALQGMLPDNLAQQPDGGGFFSNIHNAYVFGAFERGHGDVYVVRAKAPTYSGDPRLAGEAEQLRYWSLCTNETLTQRYVDCHADRDMVLDDDGYFTLIVSDEADRPANAYPENGVNWLPWGFYPDSNLIYRHMLPNETFAEAIQNVPFGTPIDEVMLEYAPQASYCTREAVESVDLEAAPGSDLMAACQVSQGLSPQADGDATARAVQTGGGSLGWWAVFGVMAALSRRRRHRH